MLDDTPPLDDDRFDPDAYLRDFHSRRAGATSMAFSGPRGEDGRTTYDVLADAVPPNADAVLDLACGDGFLLRGLRARLPRARLVGLDMAEGEITAAREALSGLSIELDVGSAQHLPYRDHGFGAVTCHLALMLMSDVEAVLAEIARVLQPSATFTAVLPGPSAPDDANRCFVAALDDSLRAELSSLRLGERSHWVPENLERTFRRSGFRDIELTEHAVHTTNTPAEIWSKQLSTTYTVDFLAESSRARLRERVLGELQRLCSDSGLVRWSFGYTLAVVRR